MDTIEELVDLLNLEKLDEKLYRGQNYQAPWGRVYGGQVLAQSLQAAYLTVPEDRYAHSLHGYFILPGDLSHPVIYDVDTIRDGGSFTTRRVVAIQKGRAIFNMSASFNTRVDDLEHQFQMPDVPTPEDMVFDEDFYAHYESTQPELFKKLFPSRPLSFKTVKRTDFLNPENATPYNNIWMKLKGQLSDENLKLHQVVLAYISDYNLMGVGSLPHRKSLLGQKYDFVSLDHSMWFHRILNINEWLLYQLDSPSAFGGRSINRGLIFNRSGKLIASTAQEGLMRKRRPKKK